MVVPEGVTLMRGVAPLKVLGAKFVNGVHLARVARHNKLAWQKDETLDCDLLLVSGGWSPVVNLLSHRGMKPIWDAKQACFLPTGAIENIVMAGSATGVWNASECEISGVAAANLVMGDTTVILPAVTLPQSSKPEPSESQTPIEPLYEVRLPGKRSKNFVDPQHDVTSDDVLLAHQEGFVSVEHLKRYTTLGMASDQGKMGNIIGLALMAKALGKEISQVGTTRFRPPYTPVSIGALAGRNTAHHFKALRRSPLHDWNLKHGATMTAASTMVFFKRQRDYP
jgi:hypothetical protein